MEAVLQGEKGRVKVDYQWKTDLPNMHTLRKQTNNKKKLALELVSVSFMNSQSKFRLQRAFLSYPWFMASHCAVGNRVVILHPSRDRNKTQLAVALFHLSSSW